MKKLFILGTILALVAILAVPMAAFAAEPETEVYGNVTVASIAFTAPSNINFGPFVLGDNIASQTDGNVTVTPGTSGITAWTVTAASDGGYGGKMYSASLDNFLTTKLIITLETWAQQNWADAGVTLTGTTASSAVPLWAKQNIVLADTASAGVYSIIITFTASCTP